MPTRRRKAFIDKAVLEDPAVYPSDDIKKRLWTQKTLTPELERARTDAWNKIKTGSWIAHGQDPARSDAGLHVHFGEAGHDGDGRR